MIKISLEKFDNAFVSNLIDWCAGGPKEGGYTRVADPVLLPQVRIQGVIERKDVDLDEVLAKNPKETLNWHIRFLKTYKMLNTRDFWRRTFYYEEYLAPRYNDDEAYYRAMSFIELYEDIKENGVTKPVFLADVRGLDLGFDYFRFDGCHRTCVCKILGHQKITSLLFRISNSSPTH